MWPKFCSSWREVTPQPRTTRQQKRILPFRPLDQKTVIPARTHRFLGVAPSKLRYPTNVSTTVPSRSLLNPKLQFLVQNAFLASVPMRNLLAIATIRHQPGPLRCHGKLRCDEFGITLIQRLG